MAQILVEGESIHTIGYLPSIGNRAPDFRLTKPDFEDVSLADFNEKKKVLNIVPSLDNGVCATSTIKFNKRIKAFPETVVLTISADLPFALRRFLDKEKIYHVVTLSQLRSRDFGRNYGVEITEGKLAGLLARAIIVLDMDNKVLYHQLVPDIDEEPDYDKALKSLT